MRTLLALILACSVAGCAAIDSRVQPDERSQFGHPYAGSVIDFRALKCIWRVHDASNAEHPRSAWVAVPATLLRAVVLHVDLPLTLVIETALLPVDLAVTATAPRVRGALAPCDPHQEWFAPQLPPYPFGT